MTTLSSEDGAKIFDGHEFETVMPKGISSLEELESDIRATKKRRYAIVDDAGIRSIGVLVFGHIKVRQQKCYRLEFHAWTTA